MPRRLSSAARNAKESFVDEEAEAKVVRLPVRYELSPNEVQIHLDICGGCDEYRDVHDNYYQVPLTGRWKKIEFRHGFDPRQNYDAHDFTRQM